MNGEHAMDARQSEALFQDADRLYREGQYEGALSVLGRLDKAFPDTKNILMPAAMCMAHLGRLDEARAIYARLVQQHGPERIEKLRNLIEQQAARAAPTMAMDALSGIELNTGLDVSALDSPIPSLRAAAPPPKPKAPPPGFSRAQWAMVAAVGILLVLLLMVPLFYQSDSPAPERPVTVISQENIENIAPEEMMRFGMVMIFVAIFVMILPMPLPIYLTLRYFGELPRESLLGNYFVLFGYMFLIYFATSLVAGCLGLFLGNAATLGAVVGVLYIVNKVFELGWQRTLIFFGFYIGLGIVQYVVPVIILRMFSFEIAV